DAKKRLSEIPEDKKTEIQKRQMTFLRRRGSLHLLAAAISSTIETFLDRPVPSRWNLRFAQNCSPKDAASYWQSIVDASLAFTPQLGDATDVGLKNPGTVERALETFQGMIEATA